MINDPSAHPPDDASQIPEIDTSVPHTARVWNYWLGGKDNFAVDREVGDQIMQTVPVMAELARVSRGFLTRAVAYLAGDAGIRQFLDVGTGLPTADNTHEVAQRVAPESRIVYVDDDPLVLAHARALLTSTPEGATDYVHADLRDRDTIVAEAARTLDFDQPVALMLMGILGHVPDDEEARAIVRRLMEPLPSGSYLVCYDGTNVIRPDELNEASRMWNESVPLPYRVRTPEQITSFFDGLDLVEPGVVTCPRWRPEPSSFGPPAEIDSFGGVGRKP